MAKVTATRGERAEKRALHHQVTRLKMKRHGTVPFHNFQIFYMSHASGFKFNAGYLNVTRTRQICPKLLIESEARATCFCEHTVCRAGSYEMTENTANPVR
jgi:hypothetical protein